MPKFTGDDPTTRVNPQALPLAPTVALTAEIPQPDRYDPQRSFTAPYGDTRRNFPGPVSERANWPSTKTSVEPMTQPTDPKIGPIKPRRMK